MKKREYNNDKRKINKWENTKQLVVDYTSKKPTPGTISLTSPWGNIRCLWIDQELQPRFPKNRIRNTTIAARTKLATSNFIISLQSLVSSKESISCGSAIAKE